jgi:uncharacterized protein
MNSKNTNCCCQGKCNVINKSENRQFAQPFRNIATLFGGIIIWLAAYKSLPYLSNFITYSVLHIKQNSHLGSSLQFFLYDTPKVLMLLTLVVYIVGLLRSFITPERTRQLLVGKNKFGGNIVAALLGIITPFCSCSAVPLFIGFVTAGIPLGITFSFLIAAPMINEIALVLLYGILGWKIAIIYLITGLSIAIIAGMVIGLLNMENYVADWVRKLDKNREDNKTTAHLNWEARCRFAWQSVKSILRKVWLFMIIGIAIGAVIHGYVPETLMASIMGRGAWWSVPLAVIIGVPMYSNAAGIIPVVEVLLGKGAALGTVLAFMMSVIALSFPEMIILRKVLKPRLIITFITIVTIGIFIVGYLFNWLI